VRIGDIERVKKELKRDSRLVNEYDNGYDAPLWMATY
jgi:hypothetical protein